MKYVSYKRVSTQEQSKSGLGLEAQEAAITAYVERTGGDVLASFTEVESGKRADRIELHKALRTTRKHRATLLISKLDRLSRSVSFISALMDSKVEFIALDMPQANTLTIHIMAAVAQAEREAISKRTSDALQAKRRQGALLGLSNPMRKDAKEVSRKGTKAVRASADNFAFRMKPVIAGLKATGATSYVAIAKSLNDMGQKTARGGAWYPTTVKNLVGRIDTMEAL